MTEGDSPLSKSSSTYSSILSTTMAPNGYQPMHTCSDAN
jgi:hypothetical protein